MEVASANEVIRVDLVSVCVCVCVCEERGIES